MTKYETQNSLQSSLDYNNEKTMLHLRWCIVAVIYGCICSQTKTELKGEEGLKLVKSST